MTDPSPAQKTHHQIHHQILHSRVPAREPCQARPRTQTEPEPSARTPRSPAQTESATRDDDSGPEPPEYPHHQAPPANPAAARADAQPPQPPKSHPSWKPLSPGTRTGHPPRHFAAANERDPS